MNNIQMLFRQSLAETDEMDIASEVFDVVEYRTECYNSLVIPRYSALPYYRELEQDLKNRHCSMINTYKMHKWIADFEYYHYVKEYTPQTWFDDNFHTCDYDGPFIVKGKTNSKKFRWNTHMFAKTKRDAINIGCELSVDDFIGPQGIIYRKYIPLITRETGLGGLPFANEWRFFYYKDKLLSYGYYWSVVESPPLCNECPDKAIVLADELAQIASKHVNFFVLDIAETEDGDFILIEINDGQMSGLSDNDPFVLYSNLKYELMHE